MARNRVDICQVAERQLRKLPQDGQQQVVRAILALSAEPLPRGSRRLTGYEDVFRLRVGRYRVLYSVLGKKLMVISLRGGGEKN